ncbi:MAG TPA: amidophosphoribosyltransferase, partial [Myxococcales bacterium]
IATLDKSFHLKKGLGLVGQVLDAATVKTLAGPCGIGHVRYATQGSRDVLDAQPYAINYPFGLAMVHNGNVINFKDLRRRFTEKRRLLETSTDLELIVYSLTAALEKTWPRLAPEDVFAAVSQTQREVIGAYSTLTLLANRGFLAFADPFGVRPLVMGEKQTSKGPAYAFASETACLDCLGYKTVRDLQPGEAIFVDSDFKVHSKVCHPPRRAFCVFEYIYFAREDSVLHGKLVAGERVRMGRRLAQTFRNTGLKPDLVIDVPSSAYFFASALAEELGVPYRRGLAKNPHAGRSFIASTQEQRELIVRQKLNPIRDVVKGKKVAVVDDSIVRGTTSKHIVKLLRESGATAVYFVSASPPVRHPCIYGIDMSLQREMVASGADAQAIAKAIGADAVVYQTLEDLKDLYKDESSCFACFSGEYPIEGSKDFLGDVEREREWSKQE